MPREVSLATVRGRGIEQPPTHRNKKMLATTRIVVQVALTLFTTFLSFYTLPVALACISALGSAFFIHCIMNCIDSASRSYIPQEDGDFLMHEGNALPRRRHFSSHSSSTFAPFPPDTYPSGHIHFSSQESVGTPGGDGRPRPVAGSGHRTFMPSASSSSSSSSSFLASTSVAAQRQPPVQGPQSSQVSVGIPGSDSLSRTVAGSEHRPHHPSTSSSSSSSSSFLASTSVAAPRQPSVQGPPSSQVSVGIPGSDSLSRTVTSSGHRHHHPSASSSSSSSSSFLASTSSVAAPTQPSVQEPPSSQVSVGIPGSDSLSRTVAGSGHRHHHPSASSSSSSSSSFLASTSVAAQRQPSVQGPPNSHVNVGTPGGDTALRAVLGRPNGGT